MKKIITFAILLVTVGAGIVFFGTLVRATFFSPESELVVPGLEQAQNIPPEEQPIRFEIPKLEIDTDIQYVGINASGNMGVPSNYSDVAWYKYGTAPGQIGSAVIDGHVDNGLGLAGVFKRLGEMKRGDDVYVVTKQGRRLHFVVTKVATYDYKEVPTEELFNKNDAAYLNLVTCDGSWIKTEKTYDKRLVVYTRLVND